MSITYSTILWRRVVILTIMISSLLKDITLSGINISHSLQMSMSSPGTVVSVNQKSTQDQEPSISGCGNQCESANPCSGSCDLGPSCGDSCNFGCNNFGPYGFHHFGFHHYWHEGGFGYRHIDFGGLDA